MTVFNRGSKNKPHWHYSFQIKSRRYRGAIKEARTKDDAKKAETIIRQKVYDRKYGKASAGEMLFSEYVNKTYLPWAKENKKSWSDDERHTKIFCEFFAGKRFNDIDRELIEAFKVMRRNGFTVRETQRSPASVNRELEVLSKIFSLAVDDGIIESNPCRKVKKFQLNNQRTRHLTVAEEDRLMEALGKRRTHLKPLVIVALDTGMRRGELLGLKKDQLDFERNLIYVTKTKTGKDRTIPMSKQVREELLKLCRKETGSDLVFPSYQTGSALVTIKTGFMAACSDAKIYNFRFHDLRHTFGTRLADMGKDIVKIAELMGHDSIQTTKRYCHATDAGKRAAIDELSRYRRQNRLKVATNEKAASL